MFPFKEDLRRRLKEFRIILKESWETLETNLVQKYAKSISSNIKKFPPSSYQVLES